MRARKYLLLSLIFLLLVPVVTLGNVPLVNAADFDNFAYNPVFWEDWGIREITTQTVEVEPTDDGYTAEANPTSIHDDEVSLIGCENVGGDRHSYMKWDLSSYSGLTLTKVELKIYCRYFTVVGSRDFRYYPVHNQGWLANVLNWNNQPDKGSYFAILTSTAVGWYTLDDSDILNHTQSYLGSNMSLAFYTPDNYNGKYSYFSQTYEATKEPYLILYYGGGAELTSDWHTNSTVSLYSESTEWGNASLYRDLDIDEDETWITFGASFRTNASTNYQNSTMFICEYAKMDVNRFFGVFFAANQIGIAYYNWSGQYTTYNFTYSLDETEYHTLEMGLSSHTRILSVEVENTTSAIVDKDVFVEVTPPQIKNVSFCLNAENSITAANILWVEAPFSSIDGLREWEGTNTGVESYENPYWINSTGTDDETFAVKCMPFQGFKTLWNWSLSSDSGMHISLSFRWYDREGTAYASAIIFYVTKHPALDWYFGVWVGGEEDDILQIPITQEDEIAIAIWTEATGITYAYIQRNAESHTFSDFWIIDISDLVDLDSWGVQIEHTVYGMGATTFDMSYMKETEIFYGLKEGISQPRFGGMWWLFNPMVLMFFYLISAIQSALYPLAVMIASVFKPVTDTITNFMSSMNSLLGNLPSILTALGNVVQELIDEFITPFLAAAGDLPFWGDVLDSIGALFVTNLLVAQWANATIMNAILSALSLSLYGDATVLPTAYFAVTTLIQAFIAQIVFAIGDFTGILTMFTGVITGQPVIAFTFQSSLSGYIGIIVYYVATYLPIGLLFHLTFAVLRAVAATSIEPLLNVLWFYWGIATTVFSVFIRVIEFFYGMIVSIMEIIPF